MFCLSPFAFPSISVPSGGGASFADVDLETLNINDSGWTKLTKDTMAINSASYADGVGTYAISAVSVGDVKYTISRASYPVVYRQAYVTASDGSKTLLTTDDSFIVRVRISNFQTTPDFSGYIFLGVTTDPTSTNQNDFHIMAGGALMPDNGSSRVALIGTNSASTVGSSTATLGIVDMQFVGYSAHRQVQTSGYALESDGTFNNRNDRPSNKARTSGQPIYFTFGIALQSGTTTTAENDEVKAKFEFKAVEWAEVT